MSKTGVRNVKRRVVNLQNHDFENNNVPDLLELKWTNILEEERKELLIFEIREEIINNALDVCYENYLERQTLLFTTNCMHKALKIFLNGYFMPFDLWISARLRNMCFQDEVPNAHPIDTCAGRAMQAVSKCDKELTQQLIDNGLFHKEKIKPDLCVIETIKVEAEIPSADVAVKQDTDIHGVDAKLSKKLTADKPIFRFSDIKFPVVKRNAGMPSIMQVAHGTSVTFISSVVRDKFSASKTVLKRIVERRRSLTKSVPSTFLSPSTFPPERVEVKYTISPLVTKEWKRHNKETEPETAPVKVLDLTY